MQAQAKEASINLEIVRQTLARIASHDGVLGYIAVSSEGRVLDAAGFGGDQTTINKYASTIFDFAMLAQSTVRTIELTEQLTFVRMRFGRREVFVAPDPKGAYMLIVVQDQLTPAQLQQQRAERAAAANAAAEATARHVAATVNGHAEAHEHEADTPMS